MLLLNSLSHQLLCLGSEKILPQTVASSLSDLSDNVYINE